MTVAYPTIPQIRSDKDVKAALDNLRSYFVALRNEANAPLAAAKTATSSDKFMGIDLSKGDVVLAGTTTLKYLEVVVGSTTYAIIAPNTVGKRFQVSNLDHSLYATVKVQGQSGCQVPPLGKCDVVCDGTDYTFFTGPGDQQGPGSSIDGDLVEFYGTSGKVTKDGGLSHSDAADAIAKKHTQGTDTTVGKVTVTQPATGSALTVADGKTLKASETWDLQGRVTGEVGNILDTTKHVNAVVGGVAVKLAVIT